jgi:hypothetical protein
MPEDIDTVVLYNELAYQDVLPVQWQPRSAPLDRFELIGIEEANLLLLQACAAIEDGRDKNEDLGPLAGEIARLDFKVNLLLQLVGRLVAAGRLATPTTIQFNARGASWTCFDAAPQLGDRGLLRVQLRRSLPQLLELPAEVVGVEGSVVRVRFVELPEPVAEMIQKLAFLRHRHHIADVRKARGE